MPGQRLAELIMMQAHEENHNGPARTLARSRGKAWIHRGRYLARKVEKNCTYCREKKRKMVEQKMGQLPVERVTFGTPTFNAVCQDLLGPMLVKDIVNKKAKMKVYYVFHQHWS
jgi:hypothetical protein